MLTISILDTRFSQGQCVEIKQPLPAELLEERPMDEYIFYFYDSSTLIPRRCNSTFYEEKEVNSLAPGRCNCNLKSVIFNLTSRLHILSISCDFFLRWMPQVLSDDTSTLVYVMARCCPATSHHLTMLTQIYITIWCHKELINLFVWWLCFNS